MPITEAGTGLGSFESGVLSFPTHILDSFEELEEWVPYTDDPQPSTLPLRTFDPVRTRAVSTFRAQIELYGILSRILQLFFMTNDSTIHAYASCWILKELLENQLESWRQELPHDLQSKLVQDQGYPPHYLALLLALNQSCPRK